MDATEGTKVTMTQGQLWLIVNAAMELGGDYPQCWEPAKAVLKELLPEPVYRDVVDSI